jgi:hypothetical protein
MASRLLAPVKLPSTALDALDDWRSFVTVRRTDPGDLGLREVFVRLDDRARVRLLHGEVCTLEVSPGLHQIRTHNTLMWRTLSFAVEPGEHLEFSFLNYRGPLLQSLGGFIPAPAWLRVRRRSLW